MATAELASGCPDGGMGRETVQHLADTVFKELSGSSWVIREDLGR